MKERTQEKSLIKVNENNVFYKIKSFFLKLFNKDKNITSSEYSVSNQVERVENKNSFKESIKNIENEETQLLKLQKQYRKGEIKEEELTEEQVKSLCSLYDKQIVYLKKSNEIRKQRLLEYKNKHKLQSEN